MNDYPLPQRTVQLSTYSRQQNAQFLTTESRSGKIYFKRIASNQPAIRNISFRLTSHESLIFLSWFNNTLEKGFLPFNIKLATEWDVHHALTCRFLPDSLLNVTRQNQLHWTYTAQILIPNYVAPAYIPPDIDRFPEYFVEDARNQLDIIVNTILTKV